MPRVISRVTSSRTDRPSLAAVVATTALVLGLVVLGLGASAVRAAGVDEQTHAVPPPSAAPVGQADGSGRVMPRVEGHCATLHRAGGSERVCLARHAGK